MWKERRLKIRYDSWKGVSERTIEPLGLVLKGGEWYVVAQARKGNATYKVANIQAVERSGGTFRRPPRFDLGGYWTESLERFAAGLYRGTAVVRASALGVRRLKLLGDEVAKAAERAPEKVDARGWLEVTIPIESVEHAAMELMKVGAECEVVAPKELKERMKRAAGELAAIYW